MAVRNTANLRNVLIGLFHGDVDEDLGDVTNVRSFYEAGLLTMDEGVVVSFTNGAEFQISLVQSAYASGGDVTYQAEDGFSTVDRGEFVDHLVQNGADPEWAEQEADSFEL